MPIQVTIIGAGLAGTECAFQLAQRGIFIRLIEQKPLARGPAQQPDGPQMAELVCSNSFRSRALSNAVGLLKEEMRRCRSLIIAAADASAVPAGGSLAVDREAFAAEVTRVIGAHSKIDVISDRVTRIPDSRPLVLATGPLTGGELAEDLARLIGREQLAYYDAISPIVSDASIDKKSVFKASRYGKGGDDYLNCCLNEAQYLAFVNALQEADRVDRRPFEDERYFEGCLPIEVLAERGLRTLAFGPMKPVGLIDPRSGKRPYAVVQLRQENQAATAWNMVGFQTRMRHADQKRVFALIPGLEKAEFERFGSVHRNTFIDAPKLLDETLAFKTRGDLFLAGQITGVEGYVESAASGLCLGILLAEKLKGLTPRPPPATTALGALLAYLRKPSDDFQPSNITWSMFPSLAEKVLGKRNRREALARRALSDLQNWLNNRDPNLAL
ncbi:MAG: methylenetetrahydrofolate--tRNA-(uracil(54)-C(5))-methyltransferase (FADH(2)-oxidizing) TrmFO [Deltaproteobacteria bacterium]|nr:methylenetetrahydrofolate--tRNA-(uracil(54)-C(5))-methyltransferase (FADH(2)-oxidizing) TrmFO [Deltaproteobacteria bacterium]